MSNKLKFFLDTEFIETGRHNPLYLLSIGMICENGATYYAESIEAPIELANNFVKENVFPYLSMTSIADISGHISRFGQKKYYAKQGLYITDIAGQLLEFIDEQLNKEETKKFEFWGYFCDYDWVLFCQLFGTMSELPKGFPYYCNDLKQLMKFVGENGSLDELVGEKSNHNALYDAKQIKKGYDIILNNIHSDKYDMNDLEIHKSMLESEIK